MFRFNRVMRPLWQISHPPAVMYSSSRGGDTPELLRSVVKLTCDSKTNVYLLGALPFSPEIFQDVPLDRKKNCQEIKAVINSIKPEVVFLGLCPSLAHDLKPNQMAMRMLGRLFDDEVLCEYLVAYVEALKYGGKIILGDRPRNITIHRSDYSTLRLRLALILCPNKLMNYIEFAANLDFDKMPADELPYFVNWLRDQKQYLRKIYVDENDKYMSATLLKVAREHSSVVVVVESHHLPGIQKYWEQPIEVEQLLSAKWTDAQLVRKYVLLLLICSVIYRIMIL